MGITRRALASFSSLADFCRCHPAFLYGLAALVGAGAALQPLPLIPGAALLLTVLVLACCMKVQKHSLQRLFLALALAAAAFLMTSVRFKYPGLLPKEEGNAFVTLDSVSLAKTPFGSVWNYNATLHSYNYRGENLAKNIPLKLSLPFDPLRQRPKADATYLINATLKLSPKGSYYLSPSKQESWDPVSSHWGLAEWRHDAKAAFHDSIHRSVRDPHVAAFLAGMVTGTFDDQVLSFELGRFGLQHLMAISGLHFSILSSITGCLCCAFLTRKRAACAVIALMTAYFIFLGGTPSVIRAWTALLLSLSAFFFERRGGGLNALGIGLLAAVFWDPFLVKEIGFQFSFGVTAAILLWYAPCEAWLRSLFPKRRLQEAAPMDSWDRHGLCLLHFLRQGLALGIAVNLAALPLTLYHFHKFPLSGLLYNLFFPPMVSVSLFLVAAAAGVGLAFPWLATWIHSLNEAYTSFLLNFAFNFPRAYDFTWEVASLPSDLLLLTLLVLLLGGMGLQRKYQPDHFV